MKTKDQRCGNCRFWNAADSAQEFFGQCIAPLPISLSGFLIRQKATSEDAGTDCPAWHKRIVRQRKIVGIAASIHALDTGVSTPETAAE